MDPGDIDKIQEVLIRVMEKNKGEEGRRSVRVCVCLKERGREGEIRRERWFFFHLIRRHSWHILALSCYFKCSAVKSLFVAISGNECYICVPRCLAICMHENIFASMPLLIL